MPPRLNKTDSPSIAFIQTHPEYIGEVRTVPGVTQGKYNIVSDIVLTGDHCVGQHLDGENRRVIRLSRTMMEGEAPRICHRGYETCVECGSDTSPEPDDIVELQRRHRRNQERMEREFAKRVEEKRQEAIARADQLIEETHEADESRRHRLDRPGVPVNHIRREAEELRRDDLSQEKVVQTIHSLQHWLRVADQAREKVHA